MRRRHFSKRPFSRQEAQVFDNAEEAWLWYSRCQVSRLDGVRLVADAGALSRPCDPDDIYRAVDGLFRRRLIGRPHLRVLGEFGRRLVPPDPWAGDAPAAARLWGEALDRLSTVLRRKGIVE